MHRTTDPMVNGTIIAFNGLGMLFAYPSFISICKNSIKGLPMITRNTVIGNVLLFQTLFSFKSRFQITFTPNKGNHLTCFLVISINESNFVFYDRQKYEIHPLAKHHSAFVLVQFHAHCVVKQPELCLYCNP